jgi:hypothetical protein
MGLDDLSPSALSAAMRGGTDGWGWRASIDHVRYMEPVEPRSHRRCHCGCGKRAAYAGKSNGIALSMGCELSIRRWVRNPMA